jgi:hypothetical protein
MFAANKLQMKKINLLFSTILIIAISSCSSIKKTVTTDTMKVVKTDIVSKPQIAEINIETRKIEGVAEVRIKDYYPNAREACISFAIKDAITKGNCDIVVQPMYDIEETKTYVRVKVSGFAGTYKKFRELENSDTVSFKAYEKITNVVKANVASPGSTSKNSPSSPGGKSKGKAIGIIGLILLPIILITTIF